MVRRLLKYLILIVVLTVMNQAAGGRILSAAAPALDERMLKSLMQISYTLERTAKIAEAIRILYSYRQDPRILNRLWTLYSKNGKAGEFLPLVGEKYTQDPENKSLVRLYLQALGAVGLTDSLRNVGERYIATSPGDKTRYLLVAAGFRSAGEPETALELYMRARKTLDLPREFRREVADVLLDLERWDPALDEMLPYLESHPDEISLVRGQAYRILDRGRQQSRLLARRVRKAVTSTSSPRARNAILELMIDIDLTLGNDRQALAGIGKLAGSLDTGRAEKYIKSFIDRGKKLGNFRLALVAYDLADSLKLIDRGRVLLDKADIMLKTGEMPQAEKILIELATNEKDEKLKVPAMKRLGQMYLDSPDRPEEALRWYSELEKIGQAGGVDLTEVKLKIAESFILLGRLGQAGELCASLLEAKRKNRENPARVLLLKGDVHFYNDQPDSAAAAYLAFGKFLAGDPLANEAIERAYLIQNDKSPEAQISARVGKAQHQALRGNLQAATELLQQALQLVDADSSYQAQVYFQMGRMYERSGEFPMALGTYKEIVRRFPEHHLVPMAQLQIGTVLLEDLGDIESARARFERILYDYPEGIATPMARRMLRSLEKKTLF